MQINVHYCEAIPACCYKQRCRTMCVMVKLCLPLLQAVVADQCALSQSYTCLCYRQWMQNNMHHCKGIPAFVTGSGCKAMCNVVSLYLPLLQAVGARQCTMLCSCTWRKNSSSSWTAHLLCTLGAAARCPMSAHFSTTCSGRNTF